MKEKIKVLLLNSTDTFLSFISERKALKLLYKEKVDIVSNWEKIKYFFSGKTIHLPAIIRLKYYVSIKFKRIVFSRISVFKRDQYMCSYCGIHVSPNSITMDHIIPKSHGGKSTFLNCVASCAKCNIKKANNTPEQASMPLLKNPEDTAQYLFDLYNSDEWHDSWEKFLK